MEELTESTSSELSATNEIVIDSVWNKYEKVEVSRADKVNKNYKAKCLVCHKVVSNKDGSTSSMINHLKKHNITITSKKKDSDQSTNQSLITRFTISKEINREYAEMASKKISFNAIANSTSIKEGLRSRNFNNIQNTGLGVRNCVINYAKKLIKDDIKMLKEARKSNQFVAVLDEWTSINNRRYMNVVLYYQQNKSLNLGLQRITGSATSENLQETFEMKLKEFELNFDDIFSITTDGGSNMIKMGKSLAKYQIKHQVCVVHAIQLFITKMFYKIESSLNTDEEEDCFESANESSEDELSTDEMNEDLIGDHESIPIDELASFLELRRPNIKFGYKQNYEQMFKKVRTIVKFFRKSSVKNEILQKYVVADSNTEMKLILDCRTRWSSLFAMLERFIKIYPSIKKALIDLDEEQMLDQIDISLINRVIKVLGPIKMAVDKLCRVENNLYDTSLIIEKLFEILSKSSDQHLGLLSIRDLSEELNKRRSIEYNALELLESKKINNLRRDFYLEYFLDMINRLDKKTDEPERVPESERVPETERELDENSLDEFDSYIKLKKQKVNLVEDAKKIQIETELSLLISGGELGAHLRRVHNQLLIAKSTSVDSERTFSIAGNYCTKIRSSLSDQSLNYLVYLNQKFV